MITKLVYEWDCKNPINGADAEMMFKMNMDLFNHLGDIFLVEDMHTGSVLNVEIGENIKKHFGLNKDLSLKETMVEYCRQNKECRLKESMKSIFSGEIQLDIRYCKNCNEIMNVEDDKCSCGCKESHKITRLTGHLGLMERFGNI